MNRIILVFFTLGILVLSACGNDNQESTGIQQEELYGRWEIRESFANGSSTDRLNGIYFEFGNGGKLTTNMNVSGTPEEGTFELDGSQLQQRGTSMDTDYAIEQLTDSTLTLTTRLRDYDYRIVLAKQIMEE